MRVRFGNHIDLCNRVTHTDGSKFLLITTVYNATYIVDCVSNEIATELYNKVLVNGYIDVSEFSYNN